MKISELVERIVFPKSINCMACGNIIANDSEYGLCEYCAKNISFITKKVRHCSICGRVMAGEFSSDVCHECMEEKMFVDKVRSVCIYDEYSKDIVRNMKYNGASYISEFVAQMMYDMYLGDSDDSTGEINDYDIIVPVPMHRGKKLKRGYNQAEQIAVHLSKQMGITLKNVLIKVENTKPMSRLTRSERLINLEGKIKIGYDMDKCVSGKKVLLVDDVYTTGVTSNECARVLKEANAISVNMFTFATGTI